MREEKLSREFCRIVARGASGEDPSAEILRLLCNHLDVHAASLYLQESSGEYCCDAVYPLRPRGEGRERLLDSDPWVQALKGREGPLFRSAQGGTADSEDPVVRGRMAERGIQAALPLRVGGDLAGFLELGESRDRGTPLPERVRHLADFLAGTALVLQNRRLCENLRRSQARMRRADRLALLGTLTAGLAHEIRNPLVSIKTYFQLLPERYDDREFRERFQKIAAGEVDRICGLVERLLEFARPAQPEFRPVDLKELIGEVMTLLESKAAAREAAVQYVGNPDAAAVTLRCDPEQLKQVLINLGQNALDAVGPGGRVCFRVRAEPPGGAEGFVWVEVEDNGIGMTSEEIERLFVPFHTTKAAGTGLGLAISRQIVEEHLGSISVTSQPGRGTTFYLHLPCDPSLHERRKDKGDPPPWDGGDMVR